MPNVYSRIVLTVGISALSPANVFGRIAREPGVFQFVASNPTPETGMSEQDALDAWAQRWRAVGREAIEATPKRVSAEYSLVHALRSERRLADRPSVTLVVPKNLGSLAAAAAITRALEVAFDATVTKTEVADVDVGNRERLRTCLGSFMQAVAKDLQAGEPGTTCFAPVGGYKAMTALGYLAGAYLGYPSAYLHEDGQILHEIPAVPIRISEETLAKVAPLMLRASGALERSTLSDEDERLVREHPYLFELDEEVVGLNAFGEFLKTRPENQRFFYPILVSREVDSSSNEHMRKYFASQLRDLMRKLELSRHERDRLQTEIRHDLQYRNLRNSTFHLFKGAVNGPMVFYAAYRYDEATHELRVLQAWQNHDEQEREANAGNVFFTDPETVTWVDWRGVVFG